MTKEAEKELTKFSEKPSNIYKLLKFMKSNEKDFIRGELTNVNEIQFVFMPGRETKDALLLWRNTGGILR